MFERYRYGAAIRCIAQMLIYVSACMLGATVICVDLVIRLFPGKKNFKIQDSDGFLSCSLGTSAGVMVRCLDSN